MVEPPGADLLRRYQPRIFGEIALRKSDRLSSRPAASCAAVGKAGEAVDLMELPFSRDLDGILASF